jgi:hypothetical protein
VNINNDDLLLDFFSKPSSERILITQVVDFSFIDISVERVELA